MREERIKELDFQRLRLLNKETETKAKQAEIEAKNSELEKERAFLEKKVSEQEASEAKLKLVEAEREKDQLKLKEEEARNKLTNYILWFGLAVLLIFAFMFIRSARQARELSKKNKEIQLQQHALTIANQGLQASEEESKQNAEELLSVNEKLLEEKQLTEETLRALQATKNELVQSEKMASIGQLTAGIAHEINNPVNYISGGAQALRDIIGDISEILSAYLILNNANDQSELELAKEKIKQKMEEIGESPEELIEEANLMFGDIMTGVERVTEITGGLRTFARGDTDKKQEADVHELIESSLVILRNKYKHRIEIHKQYEADYSNIECFPGR